MRRVPVPLTVAAICLALLFVSSPSAQGQQPARAQWDYLDIDPWCTHGGIFSVRWRVSGDSHWYRVSLWDLGEIGLTANGEEGSATLSCVNMREQYGNPLLENRYVELIFHAAVSNQGKFHDSVQRTAVLGLLAAAPPERIDDIAVASGWNGFAATPFQTESDPDNRYFTHHPRNSLSMNQPWSFDVVAVGRYRRQDQDTWTYFLPYPPCLPRPWICYRWHVGGLAPDTVYEVQLAWAWLPRHVHSRGLLEYLFAARTDLTLFAKPDSWWHQHNDPQAMQWSETQAIRTPPPPSLTVSASSDTIRVSWPIAEGLHQVELTSPDWPGVFWAERYNSRPWDRVREDFNAETMTATISGLPSDTPFEITVSTYSSESSPSELLSQISARTTPGEPLPFHAPANPLSVRVSTHDRIVHITWADHQEMVTTPRLASKHPSLDGPTRVARYDRLNSFDSWMSPRLRRVHGTSRFGPLPEMTTWRLSVNRTPRFWNLNELNTLPFVCMQWEIRIGATNPELYYDHYGFGYDENMRSYVVGPGKISEPSLGGCTLSEPSGE